MTDNILPAGAQDAVLSALNLTPQSNVTEIVMTAQETVITAKRYGWPVAQGVIEALGLDDSHISKLVITPRKVEAFCFRLVEADKLEEWTETYYWSGERTHE